MFPEPAEGFLDLPLSRNLILAVEGGGCRTPQLPALTCLNKASVGGSGAGDGGDRGKLSPVSAAAAARRWKARHQSFSASSQSPLPPPHPLLHVACVR